MYRSHVMVCGGTGCTSSGSTKIMEAFEREIAAEGLENEVKVIHTGCFGLCALGPIVVVYPEGSFYSRVNVEDVGEIVREHLLKGRPVTRLLYDETVKEGGEIRSLSETQFYKKQHRVALRGRCRIRRCRARGGRCRHRRDRRARARGGSRRRALRLRWRQGLRTVASPRFGSAGQAFQRADVDPGAEHARDLRADRHPRAQRRVELRQRQRRRERERRRRRR